MPRVRDHHLDDDGHDAKAGFRRRAAARPGLGAEPVASKASNGSGLVVGLSRRRARVALADGREIECVLSGALAEEQQTALAVGDAIDFRAGSPPMVVAVRPRRTGLSRPDPRNPARERLTAANVDVVVIVASVGSPPLLPGLVDRYLVAVQRGGATPILVVNKIDLLGEAELAAEFEKVRPYEEMGVRVIRVSTRTGAGVADLREALRGTLCAVVGHSGVGKSSVVNALAPGLQLDTGATLRRSGKGRHTTTESAMHAAGDGIRIIDTPGIRSFGLWKMDAEELRWYFPEFVVRAAGCKFRDCSHSHEPGCAVRAAAESGAISLRRHETYLRMLADLG